jgi:hypothetical protein
MTKEEKENVLVRRAAITLLNARRDVIDKKLEAAMAELLPDQHKIVALAELGLNYCRVIKDIAEEILIEMTLDKVDISDLTKDLNNDRPATS